MLVATMRHLISPRGGCYAGIGSRQAPVEILDLCRRMRSGDTSQIRVDTRRRHCGHDNENGRDRQAIRIANAYKIPGFNLTRDDHLSAWEYVLQELSR